VTLIEKVQEVLGARVAPERLMPAVACVAVMAPPPQVPVRLFGVEIARPPGKVSLKATPLSVVALLLFCTVKVREVAPFSGMLAAPNALVIAGGPTTVMLALEVLPVPPSVEATCTLLFFTPTVVPVIFRETAQEALAARVAPERLTEVAPATAVAVPPQVLLRLFGVATARPAGRLSVNASPVRARPMLGLVTLNVSEVAPLIGMVGAPKALVMDGGVATVRLAEAVLPVPPLVALTAPVVLV